MRYVVLAIIVFLIGFGVFFVGAKGWLKDWNVQKKVTLQEKKVAQQKKLLSHSISPTAVPQGSMRAFKGSISKLTETGFVVKNKDGSQMTVAIDEKTTLVGGKREDLAEGKEVAVSGEVDKKGTVTATVIELGQALGKPLMK